MMIRLNLNTEIIFTKKTLIIDYNNFAHYYKCKDPLFMKLLGTLLSALNASVFLTRSHILDQKSRFQTVSESRGVGRRVMHKQTKNELKLLCLI